MRMPKASASDWNSAAYSTTNPLVSQWCGQGELRTRLEPANLSSSGLGHSGVAAVELTA